MDKKTINFNSIVSDYQIVNPEFARVKVYVCYAGKNRNRSEIPRDVLDEMSKTIYGIPVVAEYDEDNNCWKGHGGKLEISDDGIEFKQTTIPYGFVDPKTPVFYEKVTELDGITENEYLCCYAYLWYKRYPEVESVLKNQDNKKIGQSMEIELEEYSWTEDDYCLVKKGHFSALAMLGVEPCFESAMVTSKFSREHIKEEYQNMINAFKQYTIDAFKEGDDMMDENKEFAKKRKCSACEHEFESEEFETIICPECGAEITIEEDDDEDMAKKKKCSNGEQNEHEEDFETKYNETLTELNSLKSNYVDVQSELAELKGEYSIIETEVKELREYKGNIEFEVHKTTVDDKLSIYSELEVIEGYSDLVKDKYTCDIDELEKNIKIFAYDNGVIIGKKQVKKNFNKENNVLLNDVPKKEIKTSGLYSFLDKYVNK